MSCIVYTNERKVGGHRSTGKTCAVVGITNYTYTFLFQANIMPSKRGGCRSKKEGVQREEMK